MSIKLYDAEIEYLKTLGNADCYIDIPMVHNSFFKKEFEFKREDSSSQYDVVVGSYGDTSFIFWKSLSRYVANLSGKEFSMYVYGSDSSKIKVIAKQPKVSLIVNGRTTEQTFDIEQSKTSNIFRIFSNVQNRHGVILIYYFKAWDESDNLVLDLIPVRVGNVGYMYDKVSGKLFGNSGTGDFVLGSDVAPGRYANEVAFLESWGGQYIDTGIKPSTDTKIELKCLYCKSGAGLTNYGALIGADDRDNAYILNHSAVANFTYGLEFSNNFANPQTRLLTFDSTASPQNMRVYDEGGPLVTTLTCLRGVFEVNQNLYLFATNRSGTPVYGSNRIMYCKIYDGDTLVRDYVPVEYNGTGYMYDKVSGLFFDNQGTGKFLFGSIAKACAKSYTRRQLMVEGRKRLPYGYVELEYIQNTTGAWSTSAPYINTGIKPAADSVDGDTYSFEGAWSREGNLTSNWDAVFGADNGGSGASTWNLMYSGTSGTRISVNTNTKGYKIINLSNTATGVKHTFNISSSSVTIDKTTTSAPTGKGYTITTNLMLFRRIPGGQGFPMKLYYFKVFKSGVLLMDLIPCKNTNNVVGMFDLVSKSFFRSANSGTFVAGKIIY